MGVDVLLLEVGVFKPSSKLLVLSSGDNDLSRPNELAHKSTAALSEAVDVMDVMVSSMFKTLLTELPDRGVRVSEAILILPASIVCGVGILCAMRGTLHPLIYTPLVG